jgi:hypothetical protein
VKLSNYARNIFIVLLLLLAPSFVKTASAQVQCAQIQNVEYTAPTETDGQLNFTCKVTVAIPFSGSPNIACGMRINGGFPNNVCPSDSQFEGWNGNETDIGCQMNSSTTGTKELVAYDFQPGCGPDTGMKVAFDPLVQPAPPGPSTGSPVPTAPGSPSTSSPKPPLDLEHSSNPNGAHQGTVPNEPNPNPTPPLVPNTSFTTIRQVFEDVGCKVGVPPRILERVALTEFAPVFNYSAEIINSASQPGGKMPNCPNNACAAEGVMQITTDTDKYGGSCNSCVNDPSKQCCYKDHSKTCANQWATYGNAVNSFENLQNYTPDPCNIRDNVYAAALKLKKDSGATGAVCGAGAVKWSRDQVNKAGRAYYGSCVTNEGLPYCDLMWQYYNE